MAELDVGEVLRGLFVEELGEGVTPIEAVCIVKALDEDGDDAWYVRGTAGINDMELMGALLVELDRRRYHKASSFVAKDDDDG